MAEKLKGAALSWWNEFLHARHIFLEDSQCFANTIWVVPHDVCHILSSRVVDIRLTVWCISLTYTNTSVTLICTTSITGHEILLHDNLIVTLQGIRLRSLAVPRISNCTDPFSFALLKGWPYSDADGMLKVSLPSFSWLWRCSSWVQDWLPIPISGAEMLCILLVEYGAKLESWQH